MKIVAVTGASGQLGKSLMQHGCDYGYEVIGLSSSDYDLIAPEQANRMFDEIRPEVVIHLASRVGGIQLNVNNQLSQFEDNLQIGINTLAAAKRFGVKNFLNISSNCVYPANIDHALKPEDMLQGQPELTNLGFANAKRSAIEYGKLIDAEDGLNYKTLVLSNLYGGSTKKEVSKQHMIDAAIQKIEDYKLGRSQNVSVLGDGTPLREMTHHIDVAHFIWRNLESLPEFPSVMNIGSGEEHSVVEIHKLIARLKEVSPEFVFVPGTPNGVRRKLLDSSHARRNFGWHATLDLETGLKLLLGRV